MKLFLFDKEKMVRDAMNIIAKRYHVDCYTTDIITDLDYILHDFSPNFLCCDGESIIDAADQSIKLLRLSPESSSLILIGKYFSELDSLEWKQHIEKPIDVLAMIQKLMRDS